MSMIRLEGVSKFYKSLETVSVGMQRINLEFGLGEFVAVTGESGSGKSTLLNVISGLDGYEEGELYINGEETSHYTISDWEKYRGSNIGFIFQNYNIIDSFTVYQNVILALEVQGYPTHLQKQRALELIEKVGLLSHKNHKASKLSGGQKQRAVIARALAKDCPIIVADEPTGNLDSVSGAQVLKLLHDVSKDKLVIVVTHDYEQVAEYASRKIKMHDGEVVEDKSIKKVEIQESEALTEHRGMTFGTLIRFTLRSLFSAPKRLTFLILMQAIVMIAFSLVYTYRIKELREAENTQSSRFPNVVETRILVERKDGVAFTQNDLNYFENINTVEYVYPNGLAFHNSTNLYPFRNQNPFGYNDFYYSYGRVLGTDTEKMIKDSEIIGERPVGQYEIILGSEDENYQVGEKIKIGTSPYINPSDLESLIGEFTIVGIDKLKRNIIYFSEAYLSNASIDQYTIDQNAKSRLEEMAKWGFVIEQDSQKAYSLEYTLPLKGREIIISDIGEPSTSPVDITVTSWFYDDIKFESYQITLILEDVNVSYTNNVGFMAQISDDIYEEIKDYLLDKYEYTYKFQNRPVVSLSVLGRNNGTKTINQIDPTIYRAIYPANIPNPDAVAMVFMIGLFTGILMILMGLLLYSIVHAVTKNIMKSRKKDFAIFRSIGTNQSTLAKLVVLEQIVIAGISSVIMLVVLTVLGSNISSIYKNLQYMEFFDYVMLISIFLLFGAWLGLRFNKRIFKQTVIESFVTAKED